VSYLDPDDPTVPETGGTAAPAWTASLASLVGLGSLGDGVPLDGSETAGVYDLLADGTATVRTTRLEPLAGVDGGALGATADAIAEARAGPPTINDELDKLATNVALGRNWAGIHYRSDGIEGLLLGEQVAVRYLQDHRRCGDLPCEGYRLEPFFDAYPGTLDGAGPNLDRDAVLITPDRITTPDGEESSITVDDPAR
jgi:hypothetical protein